MCYIYNLKYVSRNGFESLQKNELDQMCKGTILLLDCNLKLIKRMHNKVI